MSIFMGINYTIYIVVKLIACQVIGTTLLQPTWIDDRADNHLYTLFVRGVLYAIPFMICFGLLWQTYVIFGSNLVLSYFNDRKKINSVTYQIIGYIILPIYFLV